MKKKFKFTMLLASLSVMLGLSSCKKDWVCECTVDGSAYEDVQTYPGTKKTSAKKLCDSYESLLKTDYSDASCRIK